MNFTSEMFQEQTERKSNIQVTIQQRRELPYELSLQLENETLIRSHPLPDRFW